MRMLDGPVRRTGFAPSLTRAPVTPPAWRVREASGRYEDEGTVREARGAVSVAGRAWWSAGLAVPLPYMGPGDPVAMVRLTRHGPPSAGVPRQDAIEFTISCAELEAVVALLAGVVAQSQRADG